MMFNERISVWPLTSSVMDEILWLFPLDLSDESLLFAGESTPPEPPCFLVRTEAAPPC